MTSARGSTAAQLRDALTSGVSDIDVAVRRPACR
jgi:hypothetical protein